jgi:hypothetical protein
MTLLDEPRNNTVASDPYPPMTMRPPFRKDLGPVPRRGQSRFRFDPPAVGRQALQLALVLAVLVLFGIFCVTPDGTGFVQAFDSRLSSMLSVRRWAASGLVDALTSAAVPFVLSLIVCVVRFHRDQRWSRRVRPTLVTVLAATVAWVPATIVRRPSPGHLGDLLASNATSFPSVTAAMLAALALEWSAARTERFTATCRTIAFAIASSLVMLRVLISSSWPLDELAGLLVGALTFGILRPTRSVGRTRRFRSKAQRLRRRIGVAVVLATIVVPVGSSFAAGMRASGNAAVDQRLVEWLRGNGLSPLVDRGESWWLWRHLPSPTATIAELPPPAVTVIRSSDAHGLLPTAVESLISPALPNEGVWNVAAADGTGRPQIATTSFRPDRAHPSLVAAVAWMSSARTHFSLVAGTKQPGNGLGASEGKVPDASLPALLAAFNSGYKMKDTPGGTLIEGRTTRTMVDGLATLAIRPDGTAVVGEWGKDLTADQGYVGLRQNLHLMVRDSRLVGGVDTNAGGRWGTVRNTLPTWRSGLGMTASGDLIYVAGNNLTLGVLADALLRAGAVTAMELDIHRGMVTYNIFTHEPQIAGHKLLDDMQGSANRYLETDWRDFIYVTAR